MRYFLETLEDGIPSGRVEEVNQHIFENRKYATHIDGETSRYSGNHFVVDGGELTINWSNASPRVLADMTRLCGVSVSANSVTRFCMEPESVVLKKGRGKPVLHNLTNGTQWQMK